MWMCEHPSSPPKTLDWHRIVFLHVRAFSVQVPLCPHYLSAVPRGNTTLRSWPFCCRWTGCCFSLQSFLLRNMSFRERVHDQHHKGRRWKRSLQRRPGDWKGRVTRRCGVARRILVCPSVCCFMIGTMCPAAVLSFLLLSPDKYSKRPLKSLPTRRSEPFGIMIQNWRGQRSVQQTNISTVETFVVHVHSRHHSAVVASDVPWTTLFPSLEFMLIFVPACMHVGVRVRVWQFEDPPWELYSFVAIFFRRISWLAMETPLRIGISSGRGKGS